MSSSELQVEGADLRAGTAAETGSTARPVKGRIPMWLKVSYTAFMAVLIPVYWYHYGASNFLYFCDVALLITLVGVWRESPFLISMPAVGIIGIQSIWVADFVANFLGMTFLGMTDYMFDSAKPLFLRLLSLFHGWLPFLLVFLVWKVGYDRRAFPAWSALAVVLLAVCFFFMPGPTADAGNAAVNINYVYGMSDTTPQTWMPGWAWLAMMMIGLPLVLFAPVHLLLDRWRGLSGAVETPALMA